MKHLRIVVLSFVVALFIPHLSVSAVDVGMDESNVFSVTVPTSLQLYFSGDGTSIGGQATITNTGSSNVSVTTIEFKANNDWTLYPYNNHDVASISKEPGDSHKIGVGIQFDGFNDIISTSKSNVTERIDIPDGIFIGGGSNLSFTYNAIVSPILAGGSFTDVVSIIFHVDNVKMSLSDIEVPEVILPDKGESSIKDNTEILTIDDKISSFDSEKIGSLTN